jgi:hypothetical protein
MSLRNIGVLRNGGICTSIKCDDERDCRSNAKINAEYLGIKLPCAENLEKRSMVKE